MVGVFATQIIDVERHLGVVHEAMEKFREEINIELADPGTLERYVQHQTRPTREINHDA